MPQYMLSVIHDWDADTMTPEEMQASFEAVDAFNNEITSGGQWVFGGGLQHPSSALVIDGVKGADVVTDGPYLEAKEHLGGFWVIEAADLDEAKEIARRGSAAHDEMERDADGTIRRRTGRAGGTEGGMSTGDVLRVRAAMKPISTVPRALDTVDTTGAEAAKAIHQRSDVCAVPAAGVVAEAMVALVLAEACLEKFGGDSLAETARNHAAYLASIPEAMRTW